MIDCPSKLAKNVIKRLGFDIIRTSDPSYTFHSLQYLRHNARRLEHLASLRIPVAGKTVLEVGAGIGDHSHYYLDRGCSITITEARSDNLRFLKVRYPNVKILPLDMEHPAQLEASPFDIVHCYGLLYHLENPEQALEFLSHNTREMLFLETCVSFGAGDDLNPVSEDQGDLSQAFSGGGCRPTRTWLFNRLQRLFKNVYVPKTQPNHEEFPIDWDARENHKAGNQRAIFIASHQVLKNEMLANYLIKEQIKHE